MTFLALALDVGFLVLAFGARTLVQRRRTGDNGWRLGRPHSPAAAIGRVLLTGSTVLLLISLLTPHRYASAGVAIAGALIAVGSIGLITVAQLQMGASWRIGVDPEERTALVADGLYRHLRNPIYTGMVGFTIGETLILPGIAAFAAVLAMLAGAEIQVRAVEEPYLADMHGEAFHRWTQRSGRFIPWT